MTLRIGAVVGSLLTLGLAALLFTRCRPVVGQEPEWPNGVKPRQLVILDLPAPKFTSKAADWLNTEGKRRVIKTGEVTLVHFWTFG